MKAANDPFERAVQRESRMRRRAALFETRRGVMRLALGIYGALALGWGIVLALHWTLFPQPRWLAVLDTIAFALVVGYWMIALVATKFVLGGTALAGRVGELDDDS